METKSMTDTAAPKRWIEAPTQDSGRDLTVICGRDKSLTHRAVMFAALSQGRSIIRYPLLGADCQSTMDCFRALGVSILQDRSEEIIVEGQGFRSFKQPTRDLDCGNSGTTARLIMGILAAQKGLNVRLIGDDSLSKRPMKRVVEPLRKMGANISGVDNGNFLPIEIDGSNLRAASHEVDKASAQVKSAILLAGMFSKGSTSVVLPRGGRDHTEKVLREMGAKIRVAHDGPKETIVLDGPFEPKARDTTIPVDPSSAAFFAVLGLLRPAGTIMLPDVLDNATRTGFLKVLARMSPEIKTLPAQSGSLFAEPVLNVEVRGGTALKGTVIEEGEVPTLVDEIPILAVAAAFAQGPSHFKGLDELRVKESDRLHLTATLLHAAGADVRIDGNDLHIAGGLKEVEAFTFDSEGDHRLAMAAAVLAQRSKKPCCILDSECVRVSFPNFYEALDTIR
jgi:3-phosphoshikimate 1-carboxyvinyltransferase